MICRHLAFEFQLTFMLKSIFFRDYQSNYLFVAAFISIRHQYGKIVYFQFTICWKIFHMDAARCTNWWVQNCIAKSALLNQIIIVITITIKIERMYGMFDRWRRWEFQFYLHLFNIKRIIFLFPFRRLFISIVSIIAWLWQLFCNCTSCGIRI